MSTNQESTGGSLNLTFEQLHEAAESLSDLLKDFSVESRLMLLGSVMSFNIRENRDYYEKTLRALKASHGFATALFKTKESDQKEPS
jgi:hypothetical protein